MSERNPVALMDSVDAMDKLLEKEAAAHKGRLKWAADGDAADFFIAPTHDSCDTAIDGKVILKIERMGVPIGIIKDRPAITQPDLVRGG